MWQCLEDEWSKQVLDRKKDISDELNNVSRDCDVPSAQLKRQGWRTRQMLGWWELLERMQHGFQYQQ